MPPDQHRRIDSLLSNDDDYILKRYDFIRKGVNMIAARRLGATSNCKQSTTSGLQDRSQSKSCVLG
jgi:hypothetical protein